MGVIGKEINEEKSGSAVAVGHFCIRLGLLELLHYYPVLTEVEVGKQLEIKASTLRLAER